MKRGPGPARKAPLQASAEKARAWQQRGREAAAKNARDRPRKALGATGGPKGPGGTATPRSTLRSRPRAETPGKAAAAERFKVEVCGSKDSPLEAHHAIPRQVLVRIARSRGLEGPAFWSVVYDPRVGVPLQHRQHEQHTTRARQIPREHLPHARMGGIMAAIRDYGPEAQRAFDIEHPPAEELARRR